MDVCKGGTLEWTIAESPGSRPRLVSLRLMLGGRVRFVGCSCESCLCRSYQVLRGTFFRVMQWKVRSLIAFFVDIVCEHRKYDVTKIKINES